MPEGYLLFDERGVAQDGTLRHDGVEVDIRTERFVAILVNRDAVGGDDAMVQRRLLQALRLMWLLPWLGWLVPAGSVALIVAAVWNATHGHALPTLLGAGLMLVVLSGLWGAQRRRERRTPLQ